MVELTNDWYASALDALKIQEEQGEVHLSQDFIKALLEDWVDINESDIMDSIRDLGRYLGVWDAYPEDRDFHLIDAMDKVVNQIRFRASASPVLYEYAKKYYPEDYEVLDRNRNLYTKKMPFSLDEIINENACRRYMWATELEGDLDWRDVYYESED